MTPRNPRATGKSHQIKTNAMHMYTLKSLLFRSHEVIYRNSFHALPETHAGTNLCVTKSRAVPKQRSFPEKKVTLMKSPLPDL